MLRAQGWRGSMEMLRTEESRRKCVPLMPVLNTKKMLSSFSTSFLDIMKRTSSNQMYIKKGNKDQDKIRKPERRREKLMNTKAGLVKGTIFKRAEINQH